MPTKDQIKYWFTHSTTPMSPARGAQLTQIHDAARALALLMVEVLPCSAPESVLALDRLQESVMWANTVISREVAK